MTRAIANINISTSTFYGWLLKTNELLHSHTNEIVTASNNAFGANTSGNVNVLGILSGNVLSTSMIRGGNTGNVSTVSTLQIGFSNSTVSSNVVITGYVANITSNNINLLSNTLIQASNAFINTATLRVISNATFSGNSTSNNIILTGNSTTTNLTINGNTAAVNASSFNINSVSTVTGNSTFKANTTVTNITVSGNNTTSNITLTGNLVTVSSNLSATGNLVSISGNLVVDTSTLFVDSSNNRVGILTNTPGYGLHVVGANNDSMFVIENSLHSTTLDVSSNSSSVIVKSGAGDSLVLNSNNGSGNGRVMIAANGNIGLANSIPDALVTIGSGTKVYSNGTVQTSGDLICTGDLYANIVFMGGTTQGTVTATICPIVPPNTLYNSATPGPYTFLVFSNTDPQNIDVIDKAQNTGYQAVKYTLQVQDNEVANEVFMTEVSMIYGYGNAHSTQYGTIFTNTSFVDVSVGANSTHYWIQAAPSSAYLSFKGGSANLEFRGIRQKVR